MSKEQIAKQIEAVEASIAASMKQLKKLKAEFDKPEKFKWDYPSSSVCVMFASEIANAEGDCSDYLDHGRYRKTRETAEQSLLRNKRANRLEALVEQLQGNLNGSYYIYYNTNKRKWQCSITPIDTTIYPETVLMDKSTAFIICNILNNGTFSLDGDLQ